MQITHTAPTAIVPDVPVTPRPLIDAIAFPSLSNFSEFGETSDRRAAGLLLRALDTDSDGAIAMEEARRVVVRDEFTSAHKHRPGSFLTTNYVDATVTYDAEAALRVADASGDGFITRTELEAFVRAGAGTAQDETFFVGSQPHLRLRQAFEGVRVLDAAAHREFEDHMPW